MNVIPIAIMAHNEQLLIRRAVENVLNLDIPSDYKMRVIVVSNGCTDNTELIVEGICKKYPHDVLLISIKEKGKTKAINAFIKYMNKCIENGEKMPYVVFLDADCRFLHKDALLRYINRHEENTELVAVGSDCQPNVFNEQRNDVVAEMYRAISEMSLKLNDNSISGGSYCIKSPELAKLEFPEMQFAEDMYISMRLDGWFIRDKNIQVLYEITSNIQSEIRKKIRQEISTKLYHLYYEYIRRVKKNACMYEEPLSEMYRWGGYGKRELLYAWWNLNNLKKRGLVIIYLAIRLYAKLHTYNIKKVEDKLEIDYWSTER